MSETNQISVLSIDSCDQSKEALREFFAHLSDLWLGAEASDGEEAIEILKIEPIDIVLIDLGLKQTDSIKLTKKIKSAYPKIRVLIFTNSDTPENIFNAMDAGADGYVLKGNFTKDLEIAIRSVKLGTVWLDPAIARQVLDAIENAKAIDKSRVLPTGLYMLPLDPEEKSVLTEVAESSCQDGVCMVDPSFIKSLKRFATA